MVPRWYITSFSLLFQKAYNYLTIVKDDIYNTRARSSTLSFKVKRTYLGSASDSFEIIKNVYSTYISIIHI